MYRNKTEMSNILPSHNFSIRHRYNVRLPLHRLSKFKHSTTYLGHVIWNTIPPQIQDAPTLNTFKNILKKKKKHILSTY